VTRPITMSLIICCLVTSVASAQSTGRTSRDARSQEVDATPVWTVGDSASSSLYLVEPRPQTPLPAVGNRANNLSPTIARYSLMAVRLPEPRRFAVHDLITIIIRESTDVDSSAEKELEKEFDLNGAITDFPAFQLPDLLKLQLRPSSARENPPTVGLEFDKEFEGEGDYKRKDSFTGRLTARILDVKPNGSLVLEARKYIQNDDEMLMMTLTGTCRKDDITGDNTVLSTQLFDLRLVKTHKGDLRETTKKGLIPRIFDAIFNF